MVIIYNLVGWVILKIRLARTLITPHYNMEEAIHEYLRLVNNLQESLEWDLVDI